MEDALTTLNSTLRVARPSGDLEPVLAFYQRALGFEVLGRFEDHDGFDGVMLGHRGQPFHLEFTHQRGHRVGRAPSRDHLLVFYIADAAAWQAAVDRLIAAGHPPVPAENPYWDRAGKTFEDPDGYRIVLQRGTWPPARA